MNIFFLFKMSKSLFNKQKKYFDIFHIFEYIVTPEIFIRKLNTQLIKNYNETEKNVCFHLGFKEGHLLNLKNKINLINVVKHLLNSTTINNSDKQSIINKVTIAIDNASKSFSLVVEFTPLTTTITTVSMVKDPEHQVSTHTKSNMIDTSVFVGTSSIFDNTIYSLFTLAFRKYILDKINESKNSNAEKIDIVAVVQIDNIKYEEYSSDLFIYIKSEALTSLSILTGLQAKRTERHLVSNEIKIMKSDEGYYLTF